MPIRIGTTFWRCPVCKHHATIDGGELATVGTPHCGKCEEQEMDQLDDPTPTILHLDDGENDTFVGVALRPRGTSIKRFEAKIACLWRKFLDTPQPPMLPTFGEWLEREHGILFLKAQCLDVEVGGSEE